MQMIYLLILSIINKTDWKYYLIKIGKSNHNYLVLKSKNRTNICKKIIGISISKKVKK